MIERWIPEYHFPGAAEWSYQSRDTPLLGVRHFCVTDTCRLESDERPRRFQVSAFYPAKTKDLPPARFIDILEPRLDDATEYFASRHSDADDRRYLRASLPKLTLHAQRDAPVEEQAGRLPVLLYYPGGEATRLSNVAVCEELAARGYVVFALDAPRDAPVVVFPDGEMATPPMADDESYIWPRVADVRQLLNLLTAPTTDSLADAIDPSRIGMFGHSRGGYLANICAVEDSRLRAAANLDGFLWGFWTEGTGLDHFPADFQRRARSLTTPILRVIAEQASVEVAKARFEREKNDFGGPFTLAALNGFEHSTFETTPFLSLNADRAVAAIKSLEIDGTAPDTHRASRTLAPLLHAFFSASFAANDSGKVADWPTVDGALFRRAGLREEH